jgi:hypothetical protein
VLFRSNERDVCEKRCLDSGFAPTIFEPSRSDPLGKRAVPHLPRSSQARRVSFSWMNPMQDWMQKVWLL